MLKMSVIPSKESLVIEFKSERNNKNDGTNIKKTIVAFANTAGGDLYLGVGDEGSVVDVHDENALGECISCTIRDNIQPSPTSFVTTHQGAVFPHSCLENQRWSKHAHSLRHRGIETTLASDALTASP